MLKRNWNWKNNRLFCHVFVIGEISIGGRASCPPPAWLCLCSNKRKHKRYLQIFREVSGVFQQNFTCSKNSAILEQRTGQFSRAWGQGRPQGLHLCPWGSITKNFIALFFLDNQLSTVRFLVPVSRYISIKKLLDKCGSFPQVQTEYNVAYYLIPCQSIIARPEMETGRVDRPLGLPTGSRFFDG